MQPQPLTDYSGSFFCKMGRLNIYILTMCLHCLGTQQQIEGGPLLSNEEHWPSESWQDMAWWGQSWGVALIIVRSASSGGADVPGTSCEQGLALAVLRYLCHYSGPSMPFHQRRCSGGNGKHAPAGGGLGRCPAAQTDAKLIPNRQECSVSKWGDKRKAFLGWVWWKLPVGVLNIFSPVKF